MLWHILHFRPRQQDTTSRQRRSGMGWGCLEQRLKASSDKEILERSHVVQGFAKSLECVRFSLVCWPTVGLQPKPTNSYALLVQFQYLSNLSEHSQRAKDDASSSFAALDAWASNALDILHTLQLCQTRTLAPKKLEWWNVRYWPWCRTLPFSFSSLYNCLPLSNHSTEI